MEQKANFKFLFFCLVGFLLGLFLTAPTAVLAIAQTTDPILIDNALRGGEFQESMIVINNDNKKTEVVLSADGQIADWVKFYLPSDLKKPILTLSLAKGARADLLAVFTVPQDAPNGDYAGFISAGKKMAQTENQTENQNESSVSLEQKIDREVAIKVTDQEDIKLFISVIPASYDINAGENLSVRFIYDNQGNVALRPQIQFRIKSNDQVVYNTIFPYPEGEEPVRPLSQHEIPALKIPTADLSAGRYAAEIDFLHNGQAVAVKNFNFSIVAGKVLGAQEANPGRFGISSTAVVVLAAVLALALIAVFAGIYFSAVSTNQAVQTSQAGQAVQMSRPCRARKRPKAKRTAGKIEKNDIL